MPRIAACAAVAAMVAAYFGTELMKRLSSGELRMAFGSFLILDRWCDPDTQLCQSADGSSREGQAKVMRTVNIASGAVLIGVRDAQHLAAISCYLNGNVARELGRPVQRRDVRGSRHAQEHHTR